MGGRYGDRVSFSVLKVRSGTVSSSVDLQSPVAGDRVVVFLLLNQSPLSSWIWPDNSHLAEGLEGGRELMRFICG